MGLVTAPSIYSACLGFGIPVMQVHLCGLLVAQDMTKVHGVSRGTFMCIQFRTCTCVRMAASLAWAVVQGRCVLYYVPNTVWTCQCCMCKAAWRSRPLCGVVDLTKVCVLCVRVSICCVDVLIVLHVGTSELWLLPFVYGFPLNPLNYRWLF